MYLKWKNKLKFSEKHKCEFDFYTTNDHHRLNENLANERFETEIHANKPDKLKKKLTVIIQDLKFYSLSN